MSFFEKRAFSYKKRPTPLRLWIAVLPQVMITAIVLVLFTRSLFASIPVLQADCRWRVAYPFPGAQTLEGAGCCFEFLQGGELTGYRLPAQAGDDEFFALIPLPAGTYQMRFSYISDAGQAMHGEPFSFQIGEEEQMPDGRMMMSVVTQHRWEWWWVDQFVNNAAYPGHYSDVDSEAHYELWHTPTSAIPLPILNENFFFLAHFVGGTGNSDVVWVDRVDDPEILEDWVGISEPLDYEENFSYVPPVGWHNMGESSQRLCSVSTPFWAEYWCDDLDDDDEFDDDEYFVLDTISRKDIFTFECFCTETPTNTYAITVTPTAGGTVLGSVGEDDGIICTVGAENHACQEEYANNQGLHLKAIPNEGWFFFGWKVNGKWIDEEELLQILTTAHP